MSNNLFVVPVIWYADSTTVRAYVIFLDRNLRRVILKVTTPCKTNVNINRVAITIHLPDTRNRECLPLRVIEIGTEEICWTLISILNPIELPIPIKGKIVSRLLLIILCSTQILIWSKSKEVCMRFKTIDSIHLKVMPLGESWLNNGFLCMETRHRHAHQQSR